MPFVEKSPMEHRVGLMRDYDTGAFSVTELCARYGIDRSTFYLWRRVVRAGRIAGSKIVRARPRVVRTGRGRRWRKR